MTTLVIISLYTSSDMLASPTILYAALALLTIDGIIELGFITSMVRWLHVRSGDGPFYIKNNGDTFPIRVKPALLAVNQGHASNGAAGTAFIVVGFGGFLALWLRSRQLKRNGSLYGFVKYFYNFWLVMTVLSAIYSLACFVYVMAKTYSHDNQDINLTVAAEVGAVGFPALEPYPRQEWTPQNWFAALLRTPLRYESDRSSIKNHLAIMHGWEWNLIPMTLLGFTVMALAWMDRMVHRRSESRQRDRQGLAKSKDEVAPLSP